MLSCWQAIPIQGLMRFIETQSKTTLVNWAVNYAEEHFFPFTGRTTRRIADRSWHWHTRISG